MTDPTPAAEQPAEELVPDSVIPHQHLPALRYRDMPDAIPWKKMLGPSIMLAGLSLGSGEFVLWPYIVYKSGFIFFWACVLGVVTQYFLNMEIERWTLATGESAITGFCRISKQWAWIMLVMNIIPWAWPGWATGAGTIINWLVMPPDPVVNQATGLATYEAPYAGWLGIAGLLLVGIVLTAGPVVYNTVERIQTFLVAFILVTVVVVACLVIRRDAVFAMAQGTVSIGQLPDEQTTGLGLMTLLGALAFAGAGGTTNLGQSNFIKDKGYGMGQYIGRITSPLTGQDEPTAEVGYHFRHTPENMSRWRAWWRAANIEHFFSFFVTCLVCLCLMSLITYCVFYDANGNKQAAIEHETEGLNFIWQQANLLGSHNAYGNAVRIGFLMMGIAVLLTTELGVLDVVARISADIVKVNYLRENDDWSLSKLYFFFLWGEIALGSAILLAGLKGPLLLLTISAALNGGVMLTYSVILIYMNRKILVRDLAMTLPRLAVLVWSCIFFGYFTFQALRLSVIPKIIELTRG